MSPTEPDVPASVAMRRLVNGYQLSQAIHVMAVLGIADHIGDGARTAADLAGETGTHAPTLQRLLRTLAAADVLQEDERGAFSLTELGACLRSDAPEPVGGWARFVGEPYYWQAWTGLLHSVRTGENSFRHVHGVGPWE